LTVTGRKIGNYVKTLRRPDGCGVSCKRVEISRLDGPGSTRTIGVVSQRWYLWQMWALSSRVAGTFKYESGHFRVGFWALMSMKVGTFE
jgi:hypothetical protein